MWSIDGSTGALKPPAKILTSSTSLNAATTPTQAPATYPGSDLGAVLTMAVHGSTLYSGYQDGLIKIWDLDTFTCIRTLFHRSLSQTPDGSSKNLDDILTMTVLDNGDMFSGCAGGVMVVRDLSSTVAWRIRWSSKSILIFHLHPYLVHMLDGAQKWDSSFERALKWTSHQGSTLSSCFTFHNGKRLLLTGGSDNCIKVRIWTARMSTFDIEMNRVLTTLHPSQKKNYVQQGLGHLSGRPERLAVVIAGVWSQITSSDCISRSLRFCHFVDESLPGRLTPGFPRLLGF